MLDFLQIPWLTMNATISIIALFALFTILITEKVEKAVISMLIAWLLVVLQAFHDPNSVASSQEIAAKFIFHNTDIFAFIIWMMIISWIVKDSWLFDYLSLTMVKKVKGHPIKLFFILSYLAFFLTIFISNIPSIIILAPIVILVTKKLKLNPIAYVIWIITFANLGWAVTPISDPTTFYQSKMLWFSFWQVVSNTWVIMFSVTISSSIYLYLVFRKDLHTKPHIKKLMKLNPKDYIEDKKEAIISASILLIVIFIILFKDLIHQYINLKLENGTITLIFAFILIAITKNNVSKVLKKKVDFATLFFFAWLFVVVWALEYNWVIEKLAEWLVDMTNWSSNLLLMMLTMWSAILSVFIDNVPYNIAMVSTLESFKTNSIVIGWAWYALAWWLNSCTSIGWAGSPIGSACNVIALWQAEKKWAIINFLKYLTIWVPLVLINSFIAYSILYFRYLF